MLFLSLIQDLVFPTEIVGKRTRCKIDGSKILKVQLDPKDQVKRAGFGKIVNVQNPLRLGGFPVEAVYSLHESVS